MPRLHVITDDAVLADPSFAATAAAILESAGPAVAVHVRGHSTPAAALHATAAALVEVAAETGSKVIVNDRIDIALATGAAGVQLGWRSVPVAEARTLLPAAAIGWSAHGAGEVIPAGPEGADFVVLGAIWETTSHPGVRAAGPGLIEVAAARSPMDIIAIGGVTPDRVADVAAAGGAGVAVLSGIWAAPDPLAALVDYLRALNAFKA